MIDLVLEEQFQDSLAGLSQADVATLFAIAFEAAKDASSTSAIAARLNMPVDELTAFLGKISVFDACIVAQAYVAETRK